MSAYRYACAAAALLAMLVWSMPAANAQVIDARTSTDVDFYPNRTEAECWIHVGENEPFSHFNGDCRLLENSVAFVLNELQGVPIHNSNGDFERYYYAIGPDGQVAQPTSVYCARFGWPDAGLDAAFHIILGHATDSNQNYYMAEDNTCRGYTRPAAITITNTHFVFCHRPACALWDVWASGGAGSGLFSIKRAFSQYGSYATIQTETSISYFNIHGSDTNLWWKICAVNGAGETCSVAIRTRAECGSPRGDDPPTQPY